MKFTSIAHHSTLRGLVASCLTWAWLTGAAGAVTVVRISDMIPHDSSNDIQCDYQPNLAVNPVRPTQIVASAAGSDGGGCFPSGPLFVSFNAGLDWEMACLLGGSNAETTVGFGGNSNVLYATDVGFFGKFCDGCYPWEPNCFRPIAITETRILRKEDLTSISTTMDPISSMWSMDPQVLCLNIPFEQPWVEASTDAYGRDHVYVASNMRRDYNSANVNQSINGQAAHDPRPAGFTEQSPTIYIEQRRPSGGDFSPVRVVPYEVTQQTDPGPPPNNVFYKYAAFLSPLRTVPGCSSMQDQVVVARDKESNGTEPLPFSDIAGDDGLPGVFVSPAGVSIPGAVILGPLNGLNSNTQLVQADLSLAVDPTSGPDPNFHIVYVAWGDGCSPDQYTLHVRRSSNGGQTWDATDLRTIPEATNPALAVNSEGRVGFLYQRIVGNPGSQRWETHLERWDQGVAAPVVSANLADLVLATVPAEGENAVPPPPVGVDPCSSHNYLGEHVDLQAVGSAFHGVFSANNYPDMADFPSSTVPPFGVQQQLPFGGVFRHGREADWNNHQLYPDPDHTPGTELPVSVDPFFFTVDDEPASGGFCDRIPGLCGPSNPSPILRCDPDIGCKFR